METLPALLRPRQDGWTAARQRDFITALANGASVTGAAARVGMSKQSAYALRRHPAAADFRAAWDVAIAEAWRCVEESAIARALDGETEVYERDDVRIVRHRPCAPRLLIHLLDRADRARAAALAKAEAEAAVTWNARVAAARADIIALADPSANRRPGDGDGERASNPPLARADDDDCLPDAATIALRRLGDLLAGFRDRDDPLAADAIATTDRNGQFGQLPPRPG